MKISIKIVLYHFFLKAFVNYITNNGKRLQLGSQQQMLTDMWTAWVLVFDMYTDPAQNNEGVTSDMNGLYNANYIITEGIKNMLRGNAALVTLTGADRLSLDIPIVKKTRNKIPVSKVKPNVTSTGKSPMSINLFVFDPEFPARIPKPPGAGSIGWKIAIMPVGVVPTAADYANQIPEKNSKFQRLFTLADVGKQFWMIAYYLSPTNEKGEDGEPFNTVII